MEKWRDAHEVIKMIHDLDSHKLRQLDRKMSKKPNFDKWNKKEEKPRKIL